MPQDGSVRGSGRTGNPLNTGACPSRWVWGAPCSSRICGQSHTTTDSSLCPAACPLAPVATKVHATVAPATVPSRVMPAIQAWSWEPGRME